MTNLKIKLRSATFGVDTFTTRLTRRLWATGWIQISESNSDLSGVVPHYACLRYWLLGLVTACSGSTDHPDGLVLRVSTSRAADPGLIPSFCADLFPGWVIPVTWKSTLLWLPCQAPRFNGSVVGLVGPVSIYYDWVRWQVKFLTFWLSVAACTVIWADPSLRYAHMLLGP